MCLVIFISHKPKTQNYSTVPPLRGILLKSIDSAEQFCAALRKWLIKSKPISDDNFDNNSHYSTDLTSGFNLLDDLWADITVVEGETLLLDVSHSDAEYKAGCS
jgi:hypothetical protein